MNLSRIVALEKRLKLLEENYDGLTERLAQMEGVNEIEPESSDDSGNSPVLEGDEVVVTFGAIKPPVKPAPTSKPANKPSTKRKPVKKPAVKQPE